MDKTQVWEGRLESREEPLVPTARELTGHREESSEGSSRAAGSLSLCCRLLCWTDHMGAA